jgi:hypothetical protein
MSPKLSRTTVIEWLTTPYHLHTYFAKKALRHAGRHSYSYSATHTTAHTTWILTLLDTAHSSVFPYPSRHLGPMTGAVLHMALALGHVGKRRGVSQLILA